MGKDGAQEFEVPYIPFPLIAGSLKRGYLLHTWYLVIVSHWCCTIISLASILAMGVKAQHFLRVKAQHFLRGMELSTSSEEAQKR